jgi:hypothetical protein
LYYDVNGDGFCTPNDVLRIINLLNSQQAEGEASGSPVIFAVPSGVTGSRSERLASTPNRTVRRSDCQPVQANSTPAATSNAMESLEWDLIDSNTEEFDSILDCIAADVTNLLAV